MRAIAPNRKDAPRSQSRRIPRLGIAALSAQVLPWLYPPRGPCYNPHRTHFRFESRYFLSKTALPLLASFENQDKVFASAFSVLRDAIADRAFPAASVAVTHQDKLVALKSFGHLIYENSAADDLALASLAKGGDSHLTPTTLFDLASLTKVVATTTFAAILHERGLLDLDALTVRVVPEFVADSAGQADVRRRVTFRMLLAHSSGLPAYERLFLRTHSRDELLHAAFTTPLTAHPGTRAEYSDVGFIILCAALERMAEESIDIFCQREIFGPLTMTHTTFNPPPEIRPQIPPTADERPPQERAADTAEDLVRPGLQSGHAEQSSPEAPARSRFRKRIIQGEVQDENAFIMGGVAGHAGLFSTAEDLALFAHTMLHGGRPLLRRESIPLFTRRESSPTGTTRALGWDTPSSSSQSGKYFSPSSYGHLGYTGTSLWIDPDRELSVTLLTNRTWPDCSNWAIKQIRPRFHDAVVETLFA